MEVGVLAAFVVVRGACRGCVVVVVTTRSVRLCGLCRMFLPGGGGGLAVHPVDLASIVGVARHAGVLCTVVVVGDLAVVLGRVWAGVRRVVCVRVWGGHSTLAWLCSAMYPVGHVAMLACWSGSCLRPSSCIEHAVVSSYVSSSSEVGAVWSCGVRGGSVGWCVGCVALSFLGHLPPPRSGVAPPVSRGAWC